MPDIPVPQKKATVMGTASLHYPDKHNFTTEALLGVWGDEIAVQYSTRGIGGTAGIGQRPALIVIDMATAFTDPAYNVGVDLSDEIGQIQTLLPAFRSHQLPIVFTTTMYNANLADGGRFLEKIPAVGELIEGTPGVEINPIFARDENDIVVVKKFPSSFQSTHLAAYLTAQRVDSVVLVGMSTSGCVRAAAIDAVSSGFKTLVVQDAVGDRHPGIHWANLFDIHTKFADVVSTKDVLALLDTPR